MRSYQLHYLQMSRGPRLMRLPPPVLQVRAERCVETVDWHAQGSRDAAFRLCASGSLQLDEADKHSAGVLGRDRCR